jgi:hypothetical protein
VAQNLAQPLKASFSTERTQQTSFWKISQPLKQHQTSVTTNSQLKRLPRQVLTVTQQHPNDRRN